MDTKKINIKEFFTHYKGELIQWGSLILVVVLFAILTEGQIFSSYNLKTLIGQVSSLMVMACGLVFVFTTGSFDIASGSVVGLCSLIIVTILNATGNLFLGILIAVLSSVVLYFIECFISVKLGLISTIGSLAIMFTCRGIVTYVCSLSDGVIHISNYSMISGIKNNWVLQLVITLIVVIITGFLFNFTKIGKQAKAIGDNPFSAAQSGANVNAIKYFSYILAGLLVGIASIFLMARSGNVTKSIGSGKEMDVMIAIILGGMNLNGGNKSKISAAVIGCITYQLLSNGMTITGVKPNLIMLIKGILFLVIIFLTLRQNRRIKEMPR